MIYLCILSTSGTAFQCTVPDQILHKDREVFQASIVAFAFDSTSFQSVLTSVSMDMVVVPILPSCVIYKGFITLLL